MRFDDPAYVREQYATEDGLAARALPITFDQAALHTYVGSSELGRAHRVPVLDGPLVATKVVTVFVATK